ncbi:MAG: PQQ-binding-like beta-propeller repeat protein [Planctomycetales bacterium]|nr:PQQ-binding-like beta-propeller repeat protein [Planctomycetales bacterium]
MLAADIVLAQAVPTAEAAARSWSQWLGNGRDGITRESGWSENWPADGLEKRWQAAIGTGFSSMSLSGDRLYTMGNVDGREHVWCLDAQTGKVVWKHDYECELVDNLYEGGPGATPTIDGDRLYTLGKEGQLLCMQRHNGELLWRVDLQEAFDVELPEWGFNASPVIHGEQLFIQGGRVAALNKRDGKVIWKTPPHQAGYGSVTPFRWQGEPLIASLDCEGLRVVRAADGKEVDMVQWPSPFRTNSTTPIVREDKIFISSGYNKGCGLFQLKDGKLEELYANREMRNHFNNSILLGDELYGFDGNSNLGRVVRLTCLDFATGESRWQQSGFGCGSLIVANNRLLVLSEGGELVLAEASPRGYREIARSRVLTGRCWTIPILVQRNVYARNADGDLVCVQLPAKE